MFKKLIFGSFVISSLFTTNLIANNNSIMKYNFIDKKAENFIRYKAGSGFVDLALKKLKPIITDKDALKKAFEEGKKIKRPYYYYSFKDYKNLHSPYKEIWLYIDKEFYEETKNILQQDYLKWKNEFENNKYIEKAIYYILLEMQKEHDIKMKKLQKIKKIFNLPVSFDVFIDYEMKRGNYLLNNIGNKIKYDKIRNYYYTALKQYRMYGTVNPQLIKSMNAEIKTFLIENKLLAEYKRLYPSIVQKLKNGINLSNYMFKY